ncbi:uncharacterized protein MELLADRAFT_113748 [Melampsora larici-populina 98AG31]|uniref:Uncharacterized protein n=1 Tax=Melampsora larici-populina (strain 98AG31 / pathotype 3-4-7) TaxID=747676 RepID=F4SAY4_MELLP|nr:uncharacterized protein MELLADRAFT_113748 [Melampsora larici-populina 98AG31]EGF98203.1 hypothetical protein MELLADRAFT_113748 [Melampsora larici-populina 98AG31]
MAPAIVGARAQNIDFCDIYSSDGHHREEPWIIANRVAEMELEDRTTICMTHLEESHSVNPFDETLLLAQAQVARKGLAKVNDNWEVDRGLLHHHVYTPDQWLLPGSRAPSYNAAQTQAQLLWTTRVVPYLPPGAVYRSDF